MQYKITKRWPFIKKGTNTSLSKQEKQSEADSLSWSLYHSLTEIPLSRWMDLTVDGYKQALVKQGNPPEHELLKAENTLRVQYADAIGDHEYRIYCNSIKEITRLEIILAQVHNLVNTLREVYHPLIAEKLNRLLQSNLVFDINDPEQYDINLQRALNRSKSIKISIDLKKITVVKLEDKYTAHGEGKSTREYYMGILIELSDSAGYPLSDNITVWEFCERIKKHNKKAEVLNTKANGRRSH